MEKIGKVYIQKEECLTSQFKYLDMSWSDVLKFMVDVRVNVIKKENN